MNDENSDSKVNSSIANNEDDSMFNNLNTSENQSAKPKPYTGPKPFAGSFQLDKMLKLQNIKLDQNESSNMMDSSSFFQNSQSMIYNNQSDIDEYVDDDDENASQVEIVGWLYQFYISEKKEDVFAGLKNNTKIY